MKALMGALAALVLVAGVGMAEAESWHDKGGGSGGHSSGSRSSGGSHTWSTRGSSTAKTAKPKSNYIVVKCKTQACLKKHPSGVYAFQPKSKTNQ